MFGKRRQSSNGHWVRWVAPNATPHRCAPPVATQAGTGSEWACDECNGIWEVLEDGNWRRTGRRLVEMG